MRHDVNLLGLFKRIKRAPVHVVVLVLVWMVWPAGRALAADAVGSSPPAPDHMHAPTLDSLQPMEPAQAPMTANSPVPPLTDEDRKAVFREPGLHDMGDREINSFLLVDQLEWQNVSGGGLLNWSASGWIGGDVDRLWIRTEGKRHDGKTEDSELQLLWGHSISPWWDIVGGVRQSFKPGPSQTWAAIGVQGLALYNFEAGATMFVGPHGQTAARLEGTYDLLLTNRLILQPSVEVNLYGKDDPERGFGSGLSDSSLGLRLRYEIKRQFAPYVGVTWDRTYGATSDFARREGQEVKNLRWVAGLRMWF
jgi:copper resistance protein B